MNRRNLLLGGAAALAAPLVPAPRPEFTGLTPVWKGARTPDTSIWVVRWADGRSETRYSPRYVDFGEEGRVWLTE